MMNSEENKIVDEVEKLNRKEKKQLKQLEEEVNELKEKLQASLNEADEWKNKYYGVYADMENARKLNEKDRIQFIKYRAMGFVERLLPILDGFHIAMSHIPSDEVLKNYLMGFNYIYRQLVEALENEGVKEVAPKVGDEFNADTMHAIDTEYSGDQKPHTVTKVYTNGYFLHDRMIRAATVVVATDQKPEEAKEPTPENIN